MNTKVSGPINLSNLSDPGTVALAYLHGVALLQQGIVLPEHDGDAQLLVSNLREGLVGYDLLPALPPPGEEVPPPGVLSDAAQTFDPTPEQMLAIIAEQVGAGPGDYLGMAVRVHALRERAGDFPAAQYR
jgi:hypothetical protein